MHARGYPAARAIGPARAPAQVSVILPVHDAEPWLDECLGSILQQDFEGSMELSIFNDASKDKSMTIIEKWKKKLEGSGILVVIGGHDSPSPRGVGYSKNQAVAQSSGSYLCFLDADDVMMPQRVRLQHEAALQHPKSIIGCQVTREPPSSTERYTRWINQLAPDQLLTQVFTSNGPTVIMPTWFCSRAWFAHVGAFDEGGRGVPEDLLFFYEHLRKGGGVVRVDQSLLLYRYHPGAATHSVLETTIWDHRVRFLEEQALPHWATFTIWNAGRQGRRLYRSLTVGSQRKVAAFCDVDENKIRKGFYCYEGSQERPKPRIPVLHFRAAQPPFVICVKLDLTGGAFEDNLRSLNLQEGRDFLHFS
ncbi:UDP-GlcNAc:betaGal beta-1,3-N-acetylglucosaminyltransferase-like protein 1 [Bubalus bubalis]|uniref:UDP-GlcNAc:betaGal beta-1,3-N-acetylglucosaminyltransferase-like protein 1 n=1 Tax=Bubalus bubalis TaxID=89462 RepID=UPI001D0FA617|nr:UDP-GlcNAc:betaGal beta-1,3-N-acetylglucosaminyltransferase-like protein 1 [Bubalus bubalis]XP_006043595.2 UDP-GlcNAc:betaGal beta-1,3-N-acetylglucosaminyltransferase-like protein 1 [Bubalus bubalis]XP_044794684.1 UDP-GlcNAc:betaGal beta-1,3-N-acetylglucosaminyltransferase-like protein 1 [Bubalus bubalis]XP_044794685.1 UDP-GlcNAc:betaGal beta-1,3-N-acetylglucosaminyltransferase-like protein 1 [Bubalus bubalis]XP_044794686.1 UDP-GlcNAc:betaGal beta-1,3-N-acetylglucosaminyltransferase-like pro